jgi:hypothetical protein
MILLNSSHICTGHVWLSMPPSSFHSVNRFRGPVQRPNTLLPTPQVATFRSLFSIKVRRMTFLS